MDENIIVALQKEGIVTATFRKLAPEKKAALYQSGLKAFGANVFDGVSLDEIARAAGISKGSLFQYFTHKENFLHFIGAIFTDYYRQALDEYRRGENAVRCKDRVRGLFLAQLARWQTSGMEFDFYLKMHYENERRLTRDFVQRISGLQREFISSIIERGIRTGEVRQDLAVERMTAILSLVLDAICRYSSTGFQSQRRKGDIESLINTMVDLLFDGIKA